MAREFRKADLPLSAASQSAARLFGIKFLNLLILGSVKYNDGTGHVPAMKGQ